MPPRKTSAARSKRADPADANTNRAPRCTYSEGGRRCVKDGDGNPPLCRAHQIAVAEILNRKARTPAQRISDLFSDFLSGKRVNQEDVMGVAQDIAQQWSGMAGDFRPPIDARGKTDHQQHTRQEQWWRPQPGQGSRQPPPADPHGEQELRATRLRARRVLGFTSSQVLIADDIKQRKRTLAKKNHPDQGGSTAKMAAINDAADVLLAELEIG